MEVVNGNFGKYKGSPESIVDQVPTEESLNPIRNILLRNGLFQSLLNDDFVHLNLVRLGTPHSVWRSLGLLGFEVEKQLVQTSFLDMLEKLKTEICDLPIETEVRGLDKFGQSKRLLVVLVERTAEFGQIREPVIARLGELLGSFGVSSVEDAMQQMSCFKGSSNRFFNPHISLGKTGKNGRSIRAKNFAVEGMPIILRSPRLVLGRSVCDPLNDGGDNCFEQN